MVSLYFGFLSFVLLYGVYGRSLSPDGSSRSYFRRTALIAKLKTTYHCCKGWVRKNPADSDCSKHIKAGASNSVTFAICTNGCAAGKCIAPNQCQMNWDSRYGLKKGLGLNERCGGTIRDSKGNVSLYGNASHPIYDTQICRWTIKNQKGHIATFNVTYFHFHNDTSCAESVITLNLSGQRIFFFCSIMAPHKDSLVVGSGDMIIEVVYGNWKPKDGFEINFVSQKSSKT